jgi:antitoxin component of RelBE/YafQ-DinJ toxin-antitoxin module
MATDRTQINFRIDNDLLDAVKAKCEVEGLTQTEFIVNSIKAALGMPAVAADSIELDKLIEAKLAPIEQRLEQRLSERIANLEEQQRGKSKRAA